MTVAALVRREAVGPATVLLTLDRPERRNALSVALRDELTDALAELADDPATSVVVLTGAGEVFSAGFDLGEFQQAAEDAAFGEALWASSDRYHRAVATFPLPLVAAVNGPAIAGGMDLAVLCDLRVASSTARFAHPERTFGEVVYGPLHELIGGAAARDLLLTGRVVDAEEAHRLGLVRDVVAPEALLHHAAAVAATIAEVPRHLLLRHKAKVLRHAGRLSADGVPDTLDL